MRYLLALLLLTSCQTPRSVFWWGDCPEVKDKASRVVVADPYGFFKATRPNELVGCVAVPPRIQVSEMRVVLSVFLGDLMPGDIITYSSIATLDNDSYTDNWMISRYIVLSNHFENIDGIPIRRAHGYNCSGDMHHCPVDDNGYFKVTIPMRNVYLNVVVFGAGSTMENAFFKVQQGYGEIEGMIHRGVVYE